MNKSERMLLIFANLFVTSEKIMVKLRRIITILAALLLLDSIDSYAAALGGSNLPLGTYPSHNCIRPNQPLRPSSFYDQSEIDSYNAQVDYYNSQRQLYINCINEYIENANNDIKRINEAAQHAVDDANSNE